MKLLVILSRFPYPLEKGDKLRAYHQLKALSQQHEVYLVALTEEVLQQEYIEKVHQFCREIHIIHLSRIGKYFHTIGGFLRGLPLQCGYFYCKAAQQTIDNLLLRVHPDLIYCQLIRTAEYVKNKGVRKFLDYQDVFSKGMQRRKEMAPWYLKPIFYCEYRRLVRYESSIFSYFDEKIIITEVDRNLIPHMENEQLHVIANGVDLDTCQYGNCEKEYDLIFAGNMSYAPNVEAAEYLVKRVLPLLIADFPQIKLAICGANPSLKVQSLRGEHVFVSGWVPSMAEYYAKSRIFVAPMHLGTGLQNKLLEAMAMKLPCVTSPLAGAPLKNIKEGREILICHTTTGYAETIKFLLQTPEKYAKIAENGYQFVKKNYNWESVNKKLLDLIEKR